MKLYLIRHGQSRSNAKGVYQRPQTLLSALGQKQARLLAGYLAKYQFNGILASSYLRARQTAEIINRRLDLPLAVSHLLHEVRNPSQIFDLPYLDPVAVKIKEEIYEHRLDPAWHYGDEENLHDVYERARQFLAFSQTLTGNQLVVTHAGFMKMLISVMLFGDQFSVDIFSPFNELFDVRNTAMTICRQVPGGWDVSSINTAPHLGRLTIEPGGPES